MIKTMRDQSLSEALTVTQMNQLKRAGVVQGRTLPLPSKSEDKEAYRMSIAFKVEFDKANLKEFRGRRGQCNNPEREYHYKKHYLSITFFDTNAIIMLKEDSDLVRNELMDYLRKYFTVTLVGYYKLINLTKKIC